ncbi:hypothetical protein AVEN_188847-1 [Araneus ventricosus]|uniref:Uncharacterized protein n=1 Tax=Araneus ventricosus TaxID=182803 RepID=A0A4Y2BU36_ARAVE|nr:hypothetical protein AVEN_188847-1 [Araneus ventricosus]
MEIEGTIKDPEERSVPTADEFRNLNDNYDENAKAVKESNDKWHATTNELNSFTYNKAGGDETQGASQNKRETTRKVSYWSTRVRLSSEGKDRRGFTTSSTPEGVNKN